MYPSPSLIAIWSATPSICFAILAYPNRLEMIDTLAPSQLRQDFCLLVQPVGGKRIVLGLPTASSEVKRRLRSAPRFQDVMMPSNVLPMMASSAESTMAERRRLTDRRAGVPLRPA